MSRHHSSTSAFTYLKTFLTTLFLVTLLTGPSRADLVNVTVDDYYGDTNTGAKIVYTPAQAWNYGPTCTGCTSNPDMASTFDQSWHDSTYLPANSTDIGYAKGELRVASYVFTGSAVYVYCIISHSETDPDGNTDLTFLIDGQSVGTYQQEPSGSNTFSYNVPVFVSTGLDQGQHNITIVNGYNDTKALLMLDRLEYTTEAQDVTTTIPIPVSSSTVPDSLSTWSPTPTSQPMSVSKSSNAGMISGAVIGSVAGVGAIIALAIWYKRREIHKVEQEAEKAVVPFLSHTRSPGPSSGGSIISHGSLSPGDQQFVRSALDAEYNCLGIGCIQCDMQRSGPCPAHSRLAPLTEENISASSPMSSVPVLSDPAPPYPGHRHRLDHRSSRQYRHMQPNDATQTPPSGRTTSQKLPTSPTVYSPILSPQTDATTSHVFPDLSRSRSVLPRRLNSLLDRVHVPGRGNASPNTKPSPFMPTDLYASPQRPQPRARYLTGKEISASLGTSALGATAGSSRDGIVGTATYERFRQPADEESIAGSTAVEGGKNAAILEQHRSQRPRKAFLGAGNRSRGLEVHSNLDSYPVSIDPGPTARPYTAESATAVSATPNLRVAALPGALDLTSKGSKKGKKLQSMPNTSLRTEPASRPLPSPPLPRSPGEVNLSYHPSLTDSKDHAS